MSFAICFNLDLSKILSSVNGLRKTPESVGERLNEAIILVLTTEIDYLFICMMAYTYWNKQYSMWS